MGRVGDTIKYVENDQSRGNEQDELKVLQTGGCVST